MIGNHWNWKFIGCILKEDVTFYAGEKYVYCHEKTKCHEIILPLIWLHEMSILTACAFSKFCANFVQWLVLIYKGFNNQHTPYLHVHRHNKYNFTEYHPRHAQSYIGGTTVYMQKFCWINAKPLLYPYMQMVKKQANWKLMWLQQMVSCNYG